MIGCIGVKWPSLRIHVGAGSIQPCTVNVLLERLVVGLCVSTVLVTITWSSECPENPVNASWPWATQQPTLDHPPLSSSTRSKWEQPQGTCNLFNVLEGSKCTYNPCKFQHVCSECRGRHPRAMCPSKCGSSKGPKGSQFKRPRLE